MKRDNKPGEVPPTVESDKRDEVIYVRVTASEKAEIQARVDQEGYARDGVAARVVLLRWARG